MNHIPIKKSGWRNFFLCAIACWLIAFANGSADCANAQSYTLTLRNIAALQAINTSVPAGASSALVLGYYDPGDRGGGLFFWNPHSSGKPDGGRYIASSNPLSSRGLWERALNGEIPNVKMWGARGDWVLPGTERASDASDDTVAIQNAMDACAFGWSSEMLFPSGSYKVTDTIVFCPQVHLRGEGTINNTVVTMPEGINKDIFRTKFANIYLNGGTNVCGNSLDQGLLVENMEIRFYGTEATRNTSNACLVIFSPGEASEVRNLDLRNGGYGIRCIGGGAPGLRAQDVSTFGAAIAGISVEPQVEPDRGGTECDVGGSISLTGCSGDYDWNSYSSTASLFRFYHMASDVSIYNFKAEAQWGGGVVQYSRPVGFGFAPMGSINIYGGTYNSYAAPGQTIIPRDLVVLNDGGLNGIVATPAVHIESVNLTSTRYLIKDEVSARNVYPPDATGSGLSQTACRLGANYQGINYNTGQKAGTSRLVIGGTAIYQFIPSAPGWYRILKEYGDSYRLGGRVTINGRSESTEFSVEVPRAATTGAQIKVIRPTTTPNGSALPCVTQVRAGTYADSTGYHDFCDIYVARISNTGDRLDEQLTIGYPLEGQDLHQSDSPLLQPTDALADGNPVPPGGTLIQCITNSLTAF